MNGLSWSLLGVLLVVVGAGLSMVDSTPDPESPPPLLLVPYPPLLVESHARHRLPSIRPGADATLLVRITRALHCLVWIPLVGAGFVSGHCLEPRG